VIRLIGILTGSALAVAAIFFTVGLPALAPASDAPLKAQPPVVAMPKFVPQPEATPDADVTIVAASEEALTAIAANVDVTELVTETPAETVAAPLVEKMAEQMAKIAPDPVVPAPAASPLQNWYAFWSPFRSEIAAAGFIAELQRTTGLDYRVVKLEPGVYEVAFAYSDPPDRDTKLDRITAATGLDVSGG
jgi:hypothetical protein